MSVGSKFEMLARAGYAARGIVFLLIAGLALFSGFAGGGSPESHSALSAVLRQPFGRIWLGLIALGLLGFVAWRLAQSLANADRHERDMKGMLIRAALFGSAMTYVALAIYAASHALSFDQSSGGSGGEKGMAAWLMGQPFGRFLVGAVGIGFLLGGGVTVWKGVSQRFRNYLSLPGDRHSPLALICVYGLAARGAVFAIIGGFFLYAAFVVDAGQAGSMADALAWIRQLPFGAVLYTLVAVGLAAFGVYNMIEARYRTIRTPEMRDIKDQLPMRGQRA